MRGREPPVIHRVETFDYFVARGIRLFQNQVSQPWLFLGTSELLSGCIEIYEHVRCHRKAGSRTTRKRAVSAAHLSDWQLVLSPWCSRSGQSTGHLMTALRRDRASNAVHSAVQRVASRPCRTSRRTAPPKLQVQIDDDVSQGVYSQPRAAQSHGERVRPRFRVHPAEQRSREGPHAGDLVTAPHQAPAASRCRRTSSATKSATAASSSAPTKSPFVH